jgi:hypothetical protein
MTDKYSSIHIIKVTKTLIDIWREGASFIRTCHNKGVPEKYVLYKDVAIQAGVNCVYLGKIFRNELHLQTRRFPGGYGVILDDKKPLYLWIE